MSHVSSLGPLDFLVTVANKLAFLLPAYGHLPTTQWFSKSPLLVHSGPSSEHSLVSATGDRRQFPKGSDHIAGKTCASVSTEGGNFPLVANPVTTVLEYRETQRNPNAQARVLWKESK